MPTSDFLRDMSSNFIPVFIFAAEKNQQLLLQSDHTPPWKEGKIPWKFSSSLMVKIFTLLTFSSRNSLLNLATCYFHPSLFIP